VSWKPRLIEQSELDAFYDLSSTMFGVGPKAPADYRTQTSLFIEPGRTFVIDDAGMLVGTAGALTLPIAVPGGGTLAMAGVTEVGVRPTHRRQGMLRLMMDAVIDQALELGEPIAGLTASEGGIYRRFGYGVAARMHSMSIDTTRSKEVVDHQVPGRFRMIDDEEAETLLAAIWDRSWRQRPGEIGRSEGMWKASAVDPESERDGASARFLVVHEDGSGTADGFASYRFKESEAPVGGLWYDMQIDELIGVDDAVEATLLRFLLDIDLVGTVYWRSAAVDMPLRWRLADSRAVTVTKERDHLWLRPLDVPRCLSARSYAAEGKAVVEVVDEARPELGGRFTLDAGADGADCTRSDSAEADVTLRTPELGAVLLGGVSWSTLHRAGLVEESTPGAVDRLDALFRPTRAPYCGTGF
jgi:predicted acetyltransferase